jgi:hypothetical protein
MSKYQLMLSDSGAGSIISDHTLSSADVTTRLRISSSALQLRLRGEQKRVCRDVGEQLVCDAFEHLRQLQPQLWHHRFQYLVPVLPQEQVRRLRCNKLVER